MAFSTYSHLNADFSYYAEPVVLAIAFSLPIFASMGIYRAWRGQSVLHEIRKLLVSLIVVFGCLSAVAMMTKTGANYSRLWFGTWFVYSCLLLTLYRGCLRISLRWMRSQGFNQEKYCISWFWQCSQFGNKPNITIAMGRF